MSPITSHIEIGCPSEEVFAYATDPSRFSEWQDDVVSARIEAGQAPGVGSRFHHDSANGTQRACDDAGDHGKQAPHQLGRTWC